MFNFIKTLFNGSMERDESYSKNIDSAGVNTNTAYNPDKDDYKTILGYRRKFVPGDSLPAKIQRLGFVKSLLQMPDDKVFLIYGKTKNGLDVKFVSLCVHRGNPCIVYFHEIKGSSGYVEVCIIMSLDGLVLQVRNSFDSITNLQDYQLYEITDVSFHYGDLGAVKSHLEGKRLLQETLRERLLDPAPFI